jgi:hypothetical protein
VALLKQHAGGLGLAKKAATNSLIKATQQQRYGIIFFLAMLLHPLNEYQRRPMLCSDQMICPLAVEHRHHITRLSDLLGELACAGPCFAYLW